MAWQAHCSVQQFGVFPFRPSHWPMEIVNYLPHLLATCLHGASCPRIFGPSSTSQAFSSVETVEFWSWAHTDGLQIMAASWVLRLAPWHNGPTREIIGLFAHASQLIAGDHRFQCFARNFLHVDIPDKLIIQRQNSKTIPTL